MSEDPGTRPTVAVVGEGPAAEAIRAALGDVDVEMRTGEVSSIADATLGVVVGLSGGGLLPRANRTAVEGDVRWVGVEVGGLGEAPTGGAGSVGAFSPDGPCYDCLRLRTDRTAEESVSEPTATRSAVRYAGALAGRLAVEWLGGADRAGRVVELPDTQRGLLPAPQCPSCAGDHAWHVEQAFRETDIEAVAERAERSVDDRLGPVIAVGERESYPTPYYLARFLPSPHGDGGEATTQAAGVHADWDVAYVKALGEAMERHSAGAYDEEWFLEAPAEALPTAVPHDAFVLPDEATIPEPTTPIQWVPGWNLRTESEAHLPADRTVFPPSGDAVGDPITTGLGLGSSLTEALVSGLTEVLERDATMCAWYSTFDPVGLTVDDQTYRTLVRRARSEDLSVRTSLVTTDVDLPVVAATVQREEWPRFAAGSAAGLDAEAAAVSALAEALQNWMELRALGRERASEAGAAVARYADDPGPVSELTEVEPSLPASQVGPDPVPTGEAALDALLERCEAAGLDPYAARLTARDVESLGFEAVRVLVPSAQPLFVGTPTFGDRARTVPRDLGYEPRLERPFHPFP